MRRLTSHTLLVVAWGVTVYYLARVAVGPPMAWGDPALVYLPFARLAAEGRLSEAVGVITSLGRMPLYPTLLAVIVWATGDPESGLLVVATAVAICAFLYLGCRLLTRVGLADVRWLFVLLVGTHPVLLHVGFHCLPDGLMLASSLAFVLSIERPKRAGIWAALGVLTRFNPFGFIIAFHLAEWLEHRRLRKRETLVFYGHFAAVTIVGWLPATILAARQGLVYPLIAFPSSQTPGATGVGSRVSFLLERIATRPLDLATMVDPTWVWLFIVPGAWLVVRNPRAARAVVLLLAMVFSLAWLHFEARYALLWPVVYAMLVCVTVHAVVSKIDPRLGLVFAGAVFALVLFGRLPTAEHQVARAAGAAVHRANLEVRCKNVAATVPRGEIVSMKHRQHGWQFGCVHDSKPAYGFTDDTSALGVGWVESATAAYALRPVRREELTLRAPKRIEENLPFEVRAPSWRYLRGRWSVPIDRAGPMRLRVRTQNAEVPLEAMLRQGGQTWRWLLAANLSTHTVELESLKAGPLTVEIGPLGKKWPPGSTTVTAIEVGGR